MDSPNQGVGKETNRVEDKEKWLCGQYLLSNLQSLSACGPRHAELLGWPARGEEGGLKKRTSHFPPT